MTGSMTMTEEELIALLLSKRICTGFKPDGHGSVDIVYGPDPITAEAADRIEALTAERDRLRAALNGLLTLVEHADFAEGVCCCGDSMLHHQSPMDCGHTPADIGDYHAYLAIEKARAALNGESHE